MKRIIEKTENIARTYLAGFGFAEAQIDPLITQAKIDMLREFERLDILMHSEQIDWQALDRTLHALKGLLFNLGNHDLAEKLESLREEEGMETTIQKLRHVLEEAEK